MTPKELRSVRLELGITLRQLSEMARVPLYRLDEMERGMQTVDRAVVRALRKLEQSRDQAS